MIWMPQSADVIKTHFMLVEMFRAGSDPIDPPGVKDINLLESACFRPHTSLHGEFKYNSLEEKAAALFFALTKNHAFHNGNKRTALASLVIVLCKNRKRFRKFTKDKELYEVVTRLARNEYPKANSSTDEIHMHLTKWIAKSIHVRDVKLSTFTVDDFISRCKEAGARVSERRGQFVVNHNKRSVTITLAKHAKIPGNVIKSYLQELGFLDVSTGYLIHNFQEGIDPEQEEITRFTRVYKLLAHA